MEQWIIDGFKDHVSKLWDLGNVKVLDFKKPGTSNWHIRFSFIEDMYTLCISGDLGDLVATNYNNMTFEGFWDFVNSHEYFEQKVQTHSDAFYKYDEDLAWEELQERWKEEIDEHLKCCNPEDEEELEYWRSEFYDDIFEDFSAVTGMGPGGYNILDKIIPYFFEEVHYLGRKKTHRIEMYMYAYEEARKRLPEEKANIEKFEEKINELADMLPDYGERMDEYDPVLDDLCIKYKSVAYLAERLAKYTKR